MELFLLMVGWGLLLPGLVPHTLALQLYWPDWASEERRNVFLMDLPHLYNVHGDNDDESYDDNDDGLAPPVLGAGGGAAGGAAASTRLTSV